MYSNAIHQCLKQAFEVDVVVLKEIRNFQNPRLHALSSFLKGLISRVPLNVIFHSSGIRDLGYNPTNYKHIVIDHIEALGVINATDHPYVLIAHNLEYKLATDKLRNRFTQTLFQLSDRLRTYEYKGFANAKGVIRISASEAAEISEVAHNVVQVLPSFPDRKLHNTKSEKIRFGFIGSADWRPNARTVEKLVSAVLPTVNRPMEFVLAGSGWADIGLDYSEQTRVLGFVDDTKEFWENIDYLLAPTEQGAGVNVKICEALHFGVGVITNTKSAEAIFGTGALPQNVFIGNTNEEFGKLLNQIEPPEMRVSHIEFSQTRMSDKLVAFLEKAGTESSESQPNV